MQSYYFEGNTFKEAFRNILFENFDEYGLIIFDPQDKPVKEMLIPVVQNEIVNFRKHTSEILLRSAELEDSYHAQVKVKPINLFLNEPDGRYSLEPTEKGYKVKGKRTRFEQKELLGLLNKEPERFSPNVLLRPICQDYLLPTGFYIAGPGEISYFAQVIPNYEFFNIAQPILYPRSSVTLIEKHVSRLIDKFDMPIMDCFSNEQEHINHVLESVAQEHITTLFNNSEKELNSIFQSIREKLLELDSTLEHPIEKTEEKILSSMDNLKARSLKAQEKKYSTVLAQLMRLRNSIFPKGVPQERVFNYIYFENKYGPDFVKWIFNEVNITKFEHQFIVL